MTDLREIVREAIASRELVGSRLVLPIVMPRDQHFDLVMDRDGRLIEVTETMPPRVNHERLEHPEGRAAEAEWRREEWSELQRKALLA